MSFKKESNYLSLILYLTEEFTNMVYTANVNSFQVYLNKHHKSETWLLTSLLLIKYQNIKIIYRKCIQFYPESLQQRYLYFCISFEICTYFSTVAIINMFWMNSFLHLFHNFSNCLCWILLALNRIWQLVHFLP